MDIADAIRPWYAYGDNAAPGDPAIADARAARLGALHELGAAYVAGAQSAAVPDVGAATRLEALQEWAAQVLP